MRGAIAVSLFALGCASLYAQGTAPGTYTYSDPLGFSYAVPSEWEVVDARPMLPGEREKATQSATSEDEKKGIACVQVGMTARHGDPASVIVVIALPYDCYGQQMTADDLPGFGAGVAEGLKKTFDVGDSKTAFYTLGKHRLWIEREPGTPKDRPEIHVTIETACTLLTKAAVCWMTMARDDAGLATFENGSVTLEADPASRLVPSGTFTP